MMMNLAGESNLISRLSPTELVFCPKGNVAEVVTRRDFSEEKRKQIQKLHVLDKRWNLVIPLHFLLWVGAGYLSVATGNWALNIGAYMIGGMSLSTLSVLAHESTHNLLTRSRKIDRWIGFFCGLPILFSTAGYRVIHSIHHKHVRSEDDPDDIENVTRDPLLLRLVYIAILVVAIYVYLVQVPLGGWKKGTSEERREIVVEGAIILAFLVMACILLPASVIVEAWLIPLLVAGCIANIRGIAEHGLTSKGNELVDTRTVATNPVMGFLMCNINYHLEHHLYPGVPWYNLPRLHRILQDEYRRAGSSVYTSYAGFMLDVFKAIVKGPEPGQRLIPSQLREKICL